MMNKGRSENTRTITQDEKERVLDDLEQRKKFLDDGIQNMSVTLYSFDCGALDFPLGRFPPEE